MRKGLSLLLVAAALCGVVSAQNLSKSNDVYQLPVATNTFKTPSKVQGSMNFTYFSGEKLGMLGVGTTETYDCAIFIPETFAGKKITEIGFMLIDKSVLKDVKCWVANSLPSNVARSGFYATIANSDLKDIKDEEYSGVQLGDKAFVVPASGCYVGYTFTVTKATSQEGQYPIAITYQQEAKEGGLFLRTSKSVTSWTDCYSQGYGNLSTIVTLEGDFAENVLTVPSTFNVVKTLVNGSAHNAGIIVTNGGSNEISNFAYTVEDMKSGKVSDEKTIKLANAISAFSTATVSIPFTPEAEVGSYAKKVTFTKVNGEANAADADKMATTGDVFTLSKQANRKVVEEEFTATGCGWCPRGIVGMQQCEKNVPDNWIGIAVHGSISYRDPMQITAYNDVLGSVEGFPSAYLNRVNSVDPLYGTSNDGVGIVDDVKSLANELPEAAVTVSADWSEDNNIVNVKSDVTFFTNYDKAPYGVAYVLVADSLHGTTSGWYQTNYFAHPNYKATFLKDPYLKEWAQKSTSVAGKDMWYNHVAIDAQDILKGADGSVSAPIVADAVQTHTTTFDLTKGISSVDKTQLVQNKKNLKVVAMLINRTTGEIVNADETIIAGGSFTAINDATMGGKNAVEVARYTLDGVKLAAPQKGLNIVKMSDGRIVKVLVK